MKMLSFKLEEVCYAPPFFLKKMKNITIYKYIATSRPLDAYSLISKTGDYKRPKDAEDLETQLKHYVRQNGGQGLMELAKIHPDKDLIIDMFKETDLKLRNDLVSPMYNNMNGNSEPTTTTITKQESEKISLSKMMIWGSVVLISVAIIMKPR